MDAEGTKALIAEVNATLKGYEVEFNKAIDTKIAAGVDASNKEVVELKKQLAQVKESLDLNAKQLLLIGTGIPGLGDEIKKGKVDFSIAKVCQALWREKAGRSEPGIWDGFTGDAWRSTNKDRDCAQEKEIIDATMEYRKKASNFSTALEAGGVLIPQEILDLVGLVYAAIPLLDKLPVLKLEGLVGDVRVPRLQSGFTAYQVGENVEPTASSVKYSEYVMRPRRSAGLTFQSKTLMFQSGGASDKVVKENLQLALARQIHQMLLTGNGNGYQPKGLYNWIGTDLTEYIQSSGISASTTGLVTTNGGRFTITDAIMLKAFLEEQNEGDAAPENYGFLMRPVVKYGMMTERVALNAGLKGLPVTPTMPYLSEQVMKDTAGLIATSTQVPRNETKGTSSTTSKVFYGNWKYFYVGMWQDMSLRVSDQAYAQGISAFSQNGMFIIAEQAVDCAVTRPTALTYADGCETTIAKWL